MDGPSEIAWASQHLKKDCVFSSLYKLALAGTVYHFWHERNCTNFQNKSKDPMSVFRGRVCSWKPVAATLENVALCHAWNLPPKLLIRPILL